MNERSQPGPAAEKSIISRTECYKSEAEDAIKINLHVHLGSYKLSTLLDIIWLYRARRGNEPECHERVRQVQKDQETVWAWYFGASYQKEVLAYHHSALLSRPHRRWSLTRPRVAVEQYFSRVPGLWSVPPWATPRPQYPVPHIPQPHMASPPASDWSPGLHSGLLLANRASHLLTVLGPSLTWWWSGIIYLTSGGSLATDWSTIFIPGLWLVKLRLSEDMAQSSGTWGGLLASPTPPRPHNPPLLPLPPP